MVRAKTLPDGEYDLIFIEGGAEFCKNARVEGVLENHALIRAVVMSERRKKAKHAEENDRRKKSKSEVIERRKKLKDPDEDEKVKMVKKDVKVKTVPAEGHIVENDEHYVQFEVLSSKIRFEVVPHDSTAAAAPLSPLTITKNRDDDDDEKH
ncbi:hypothetical protein Tcan_11869 [Toxocara canis]|uniref:Uncharacterized protein n=1 Tax=Toxocara canis TaxID=6265 RepID=A0A0B2V8L6_TOXCA|nr:hypothetical protein Tcan_11869 [Toxocara canis]